MRWLFSGWLYATQRGKARSNKMPPWNWTGDLRPYPIGPTRTVPDHIPRPDYGEAPLPSHLRPHGVAQNLGRLLLLCRTLMRGTVC